MVVGRWLLVKRFMRLLRRVLSYSEVAKLKERRRRPGKRSSGGRDLLGFLRGAPEVGVLRLELEVIMPVMLRVILVFEDLLR
jgi:hypothetical protein